MLKMGCAKIDVTPDFPVYQRGYGARNQKTVLVENPVEAGVIALEQDGRRFLLITADLVGVPYRNCRIIYERLKQEFGIGWPEVVISASHTHFAPGFGPYVITFSGGALERGVYLPDDEYFEFWFAKLRIAVRAALADLEEVTLSSAAVPVSGIAYNRRLIRKSDGVVQTHYTLPENLDDYDFSPIDETFHIWRFNKGNRPKALLGRYGCHPVTGGAEYYGISADYPGCFKQCVQNEFGCPGFFWLGTAGDVVPMRRNGHSRQDLGEILTRAIRLNELNFRAENDFILDATGFTLHGTPVMVLDHGRREELLQAAFAAAAQSAEPYNAALSETAQRYLVTSRYPQSGYDIPIQLLRLGGKVAVFIPFEVFTDIGLALRKACPEAVIVSISGGHEGYLPLQSDFALGGYETQFGATFAPDTGDRLLAACVEEIGNFQSRNL